MVPKRKNGQAKGTSQSTNADPAQGNSAFLREMLVNLYCFPVFLRVVDAVESSCGHCTLRNIHLAIGPRQNHMISDF